jgi:hypothetical protein
VSAPPRVRPRVARERARRPALVVADALAAPWRGPFDTVLAAEVLYDRAAFAPLAAAFASALAPTGVVRLTDGHRIDTRAFYDEARTAGLTCTTEDVPVDEEGVRNTITVVTMRHRATASGTSA